MTVNNVFFDAKLNKLYKMKLDFHEKNRREQKVELLFPSSMTEYISFWLNFMYVVLVPFL
jgi:hypothetical protein